jgi:hypothetical protein
VTRGEISCAPAALFIEQGVHPRVVIEILEHSDLRLAQRYTHVPSAMAATLPAAWIGRSEEPNETKLRPRAKPKDSEEPPHNVYLCLLPSRLGDSNPGPTHYEFGSRGPQQYTEVHLRRS